MTQVTLKREHNPLIGSRYTVEAKGHATGSVQMCAAISALLQTLQAWLHDSDATVIEEAVDYGDVRLRFAGMGASTAFTMMCCGFLRLQATEPDKIKCEIEK